MRKMKIGILMVVAVLALVSVASAAFPASVDALMTHPNANNAYWAADILTPGVNPEVPYNEPAPGYDGYCIDPNHYLHSGNTYTFTAYTSTDNGAKYQLDHPGAPNAVWPKINYILNNDPATIDSSTVWVLKQAAIWHYDGMSGVEYPEGSDLPGYYHSEYKTYINQIDKAVDVDGWKLPKCDANYAVILYKEGNQVVIISVPQDDCGHYPEYPSLALPVGMLIGLIGVVQYVRTRKE